jgi:2-polyprenyl-3-methyl-5-hydroxy-6-metoxy-1,4-benzoquinol methylase
MHKELNYKVLVQEWDEIALERFNDLKAGNDKSYIEILKPNLLFLLRNSNLTNVLEIGCGVGVFTEELGKLTSSIKAIDISCKSIDIATANSKNKYIRYECKNFFDLKEDSKYTTILSNMTLQAIPDISDLFNKVESLLTQNGTFIFTITHPSFWPIYWNYNNSRFNYNNEVEIVTDFKTRNKTYINYKTRHYHRPIEYYINLITSSGLSIKNFMELRDKKEDNLWYPRFLLVECKKEK